MRSELPGSPGDVGDSGHQQGTGHVVGIRLVVHDEDTEAIERGIVMLSGRFPERRMTAFQLTGRSGKDQSEMTCSATSCGCQR